MKKIIFFFVALFSLAAADAQVNPVSWSYTATKIADKTYEVHITATIQTGWHLYSQVQPEDAIVDPTSIVFAGNPLIGLEGKIKELGKMEKFHDAQLEVSANQYSSKVDFVQVVKLKTNAKTNLSGKVTFQTCDDQKCLPPKTINFAVAIK
ncbi:MAG: protein-disulfide reductase DsbD domain-containing protein [Chitinophagaceae bacterium]